MRHFMVDPDNEERLLKVPYRVVQAIKAEALDEAVQRVQSLADDIYEGKDGVMRAPTTEIIAAINGIAEQPTGTSQPSAASPRED